MFKKTAIYAKITVLLGIILVAIYIIQIQIYQSNHTRIREVIFYKAKNSQSDLAVLHLYSDWSDGIFGYVYNRPAAGDDWISVVQKQSTNKRRKKDRKNVVRINSPVLPKEQSHGIIIKNSDQKKGLVDKKKHIMGSPDKSFVNKSSLSEPEKENNVESSDGNKQKESFKTSGTTYSSIPIGYNQIRNRLNSLVHKGSASENVPTSGGITSGSMHQLVLDETRTNIGGDFFTAFNNQWQSIQNNADYTIAISEKPLPSLGTMVIVRVNNEIVYQTRLNPNNKYINWIAGEAISYVRQKLQNQQVLGY